MNGIGILSRNNTERAAGRTVQQTDERKAEKEKERLKKACADFESLFIYNMLKNMRSTIPSGGALTNYAGKDTYNMLLDQQIATDIAHSRSGGLGLQKVLFEQMSKTLQNKAIR